MRIQDTKIFLASGLKVGGIIPNGPGWIVTLQVTPEGVPTAAACGETKKEAMQNASAKLASDLINACRVCDTIRAEVGSYQEPPVPNRAHVLADLRKTLANLETLKRQLRAMGVDTERADRLDRTIRETQEMVNSLN